MRLSDLTIKDLLILEKVGARLHSSRSLSGKPRLVLSNLSDARASPEPLPLYLHALLNHYIDQEVITLIGDICYEQKEFTND